MRRWLLLLIFFPISAAFSGQEHAIKSTKAVEMRISGVLISTTSRSALINGEVAREGERVGGVEILAIDQDGVRVLNGSRELMIPVGSTARVHTSRVRQPNLPPADRQASPGIHRVEAGETLSEIAEHYAGRGASLNQVMMALFDANPDAFDGNINRLRAGAALRIPPGTEIRRRSPEFALAEVLRQTESWQSASGPPRVAKSSPPVETEPRIAEAGPQPTPKHGHYGPVGYGETLSGIAVQVAADGVSMHRMMSALFAENPQAFGGSIDLLHEGAVLRVPDLNGVDPGAVLAANRR